jgi:hypothetical protein
MWRKANLFECEPGNGTEAGINSFSRYLLIDSMPLGVDKPVEQN